MPKINLYVPDDLKAQMDDTGEGVNWSAVAQRAFKEAISTYRVEKNDADISRVVERLRASMERYVDRQLAAGKQVGARWAKKEAEYFELVAVAEFNPDTHPEAIDQDTLRWLIDPDGETDTHSWSEFWEQHYGRGKPSGAFIRGFIEGATEIYDEIAEQL